MEPFEKYKSILIGKDYNQIKGLDYFEIYSPFAKLTTIKTVISFTFIHNSHIHQLDVNNAFLHG